MTGGQLTIQVYRDGVEEPKIRFPASSLEQAGELRISYTDGEDPCTLVLGKTEGRMLRRGEGSTELAFTPGKAFRTQYTTPYGSIPIVVETSQYKVVLTQDGCEARLSYRLLSDEQTLTECQMQIRYEKREL